MTSTHARIVSLGEHRPAGTVSNDDLAARGLDTTDEWIRTRTGIATRHVAAADETVVSMGIDAAAKALAAAAAMTTTATNHCAARFMPHRRQAGANGCPPDRRC